MAEGRWKTTITSRKEGFFSLCSVGEDECRRKLKSIPYYLASPLFLINPNLHAERKRRGTTESGESSEGEMLLSLVLWSFFFFFFLFGRVNGGKAISCRPFNHVMTGPGPVSVCVCVCLNCGPIDQSQCWCDGIEGQGWPWTQQLSGSLPSFPTPIRPERSHLSKFYLIPEVLDLSVIAYERGDWPPLWAFF